MDGAESSSESDMEEHNKSEEEMNITVKCVFFRGDSGEKRFLFFYVGNPYAVLTLMPAAWTDEGEKSDP